MLSKGGQKLQDFVDKALKEIAEWFLKNKEELKKIIEKVKKNLSKIRRVKFRTTKMLKKYIGEENGIVLFNFSKVKYLTEVERLEYELVIIDGKFYTKSGKLFDTALGGIDRFRITGKAIFVMNKEGRIFATLDYPIGTFHHSSFFAGAEVAAAGEITVIKGVIKFVSKQSGHYQPSTKYMKQFMQVLKENGIDTKIILTNF